MHDICREKERIRLDLEALKKYNEKLLRLELKFQSTRREMKRLIRSKMYSNFSNKQSENAITKKFWPRSLSVGVSDTPTFP